MRAIRLIARIAACSCVAFIAFVTLSPIGLRPVVTGMQVEHLVAFGAAGVLIGISFPRHLWQGAAALVAMAVVLEAMQNLVPGRHGRVLDMDVKILGSMLGTALSMIVNDGLVYWQKLVQKQPLVEDRRD